MHVQRFFLRNVKEHVLQRKIVAVPFVRRNVPGEDVSD